MIAPEATTTSEVDAALKAHLRIETFRNRVSQALASNALDPAGLVSVQERFPFYRLLNSELDNLERDVTPFLRTYCAWMYA